MGHQGFFIAVFREICERLLSLFYSNIRQLTAFNMEKSGRERHDRMCFFYELQVVIVVNGTNYMR
jgi:hypothetical protein